MLLYRTFAGCKDRYIFSHYQHVINNMACLIKFFLHKGPVAQGHICTPYDKMHEIRPAQDMYAERCFTQDCESPVARHRHRPLHQSGNGNAQQCGPCIITDEKAGHRINHRIAYAFGLSGTDEDPVPDEGRTSEKRHEHQPRHIRHGKFHHRPLVRHQLQKIFSRNTVNEKENHRYGRSPYENPAYRILETIVTHLPHVPAGKGLSRVCETVYKE